MAIDTSDILPNTAGGWWEMIGWLGTKTDGMFWVFIILGVLVVFGFPMLNKWGKDWALFSTGILALFLALFVWIPGGLLDEQFYGFVLYFIAGFVKFTVFPD